MNMKKILLATCALAMVGGTPGQAMDKLWNAKIPLQNRQNQRQDAPLANIDQPTAGIDLPSLKSESKDIKKLTIDSPDTRKETARKSYVRDQVGNLKTQQKTTIQKLHGSNDIITKLNTRDFNKLINSNVTLTHNVEKLEKQCTRAKQILEKQSAAVGKSKDKITELNKEIKSKNKKLTYLQTALETTTETAEQNKKNLEKTTQMYQTAQDTITELKAYITALITPFASSEKAAEWLNDHGDPKTEEMKTACEQLMENWGVTYDDTTGKYKTALADNENNSSLDYSSSQQQSSEENFESSNDEGSESIFAKYENEVESLEDILKDDME